MSFITSELGEIIRTKDAGIIPVKNALRGSNQN
jgi:hypothetical protein